MKKYKEIEITEKVCTEIQCDVCKRVFGDGDDFEIQEFQFIDFDGGYTSVFGDGARVKVDICQHCFDKMLTHAIPDLVKYIN